MCGGFCLVSPMIFVAGHPRQHDTLIFCNGRWAYFDLQSRENKLKHIYMYFCAEPKKRKGKDWPRVQVAFTLIFCCFTIIEFLHLQTIKSERAFMLLNRFTVRLLCALSLWGHEVNKDTFEPLLKESDALVATWNDGFGFEKGFLLESCSLEMPKVFWRSLKRCYNCKSEIFFLHAAGNSFPGFIGSLQVAQTLQAQLIFARPSLVWVPMLRGPFGCCLLLSSYFLGQTCIDWFVFHVGWVRFWNNYNQHPRPTS